MFGYLNSVAMNTVVYLFELVFSGKSKCMGYFFISTCHFEKEDLIVKQLLAFVLPQRP